jgi:hypothetical protein
MLNLPFKNFMRFFDMFDGDFPFKREMKERYVGLGNDCIYLPSVSFLPKKYIAQYATRLPSTFAKVCLVDFIQDESSDFFHHLEQQKVEKRSAFERLAPSMKNFLDLAVCNRSLSSWTQFYFECSHLPSWIPLIFDSGSH